MIEIIEHKDYNKPVDNDTVVETLGTNNQKIKLFKVFDGVWIDPEAIELPDLEPTDKLMLAPYQEEYCKTIEQKSKYLKQMSILFKRINSVPLGQELLKELHKGSPLDFSNIETWDNHNMITSSVKDDLINRKLRATCIIKPNYGYLQFLFYAKVSKANYIGTSKGCMHFHPDCIMSIKKDKNICFVDPSIVLFHELTHVLHNTYGVSLTIPSEEFITFGHKDSRMFALSKHFYGEMHNLLSTNLSLLQQAIDTLPNQQDKEYYKEKYDQRFYL